MHTHATVLLAFLRQPMTLPAELARYANPSSEAYEQ